MLQRGRHFINPAHNTVLIKETNKKQINIAQSSDGDGKLELEPPTILFLGYFNNVSRKDVGIVVTEAGQHVHLKTFVNI